MDNDLFFELEELVYKYRRLVSLSEVLHSHLAEGSKFTDEAVYDDVFYELSLQNRETVTNLEKLLIKINAQN